MPTCAAFSQRRLPPVRLIRDKAAEVPRRRLNNPFRDRSVQGLRSKPHAPQSCAVSISIHTSLLSNPFIFRHAACPPNIRRLCDSFVLGNASDSPTSTSLCTCSRSSANSACNAVTSFSTNDIFTVFSQDTNGVCTTQVCGALYVSELLPRLGQRPYWRSLDR